MAMLEVTGLSKTYSASRQQRFGRVQAVSDVSVSVGQGEFFTLLGPSGCGKTTLLRCVSGLEHPDDGRIAVAGTELYSAATGIDVPVYRRGLGMVFQSYAIWPHMNVFDNAAFSLTVRSRRPSASSIKEAVHRALELVELDGLATRMATDLSGGQQQRLALARAIVQEPPLLLLDEPLSNLDAKLRQSMRTELKRLQRELGLTILYVTHDQAEALAMSTLVAVLREGRVEQIGAPKEIYQTPRTRFVADFVGVSTFVVGTVSTSDEPGHYVVDTAIGHVLAKAAGEFEPGDKVEVAVRPENVTLAAGAPPGAAVNRFAGRVREATFLGDVIDYRVLVNGTDLAVRCHPSMDHPIDSEVTVALDADGCSVVAD
jgi:iron(III) transport system ATP-binding protein